MTWGAVAGAAISTVGGAIASNQSSKAAGRAAGMAAPYNIAGPFGSVTYGPNHTANYALNGVGQQFGDMAQNLGLGTLGNVTANPLDAVTPDIMSGYNNAMGVNSTLGANANANAGSLFSMLKGLGNDPTAIGNHMYELLRRQAAPGESLAFNSLQQKLFGQGRLGDTGGAGELKAMFDSNSQADIGRQIAGANYGMQWQGQLQNQYGNASNAAQGIAADRYGLAQNLLQTGMGINSGNTSQASNLQGLYSSLFAPLLAAQATSNRKEVLDANAAGAAYRYGADNNSINAYTNMFGQLTKMLPTAWGGAGGGGFGGIHG